MTAHGTDHEPPDDADPEPDVTGHGTNQDPSDESAEPATQDSGDDEAAPSQVTELAQLLRSRREQWRPRMSRLRASQLSGVNVSSIEAWETGRVAKPPIHDVMRLAHVLLISPKELQHTVFADQPLPEAADEEAPRGWLLLERAMAVLEWGDQDVANALNATTERVRELRDGAARPSAFDTMTLGLVLGAYPDGLDGASNDDVFGVLEQMRS